MINRFICAGSMNVDFIFHVDRMPEEHEKLRSKEAFWACGGSAANTAYWLARLGGRVQMAGCVGDDPLGRLCLDELAHAGVDVRTVHYTHNTATGVAAILINHSSKRMVTSGGANAFLSADHALKERYTPGVHLHVAFPMTDVVIQLLRQAKNGGATTSCDLDNSLEPEMLRLLDICFMNYSKFSRWAGPCEPRDAWEKVAHGEGFTLVITQGAAGVTAVQPDGGYFVPAMKTEVLDRTGGGDAFIAGFLIALSKGRKTASCLRSGLAMAAQVITGQGSRPQTVNLEYVEAVLRAE